MSKNKLTLKMFDTVKADEVGIQIITFEVQNDSNETITVYNPQLVLFVKNSSDTVVPVVLETSIYEESLSEAAYVAICTGKFLSDKLIDHIPVFNEEMTELPSTTVDIVNKLFDDTSMVSCE